MGFATPLSDATGSELERTLRDDSATLVDSTSSRTATVIESDDGAPRAFKADTSGPILSKTAEDDPRIAITTAVHLAREARDAFKVACRSDSPDNAELMYFECKETVEKLWAYSSIRSQATRDLLGLVDSAIKHRELVSWTAEQKVALENALVDLARPFVDPHDVERNIQSFAENDIDITGPIFGRPEQKRYRVTIVEEA